MECLPAMAHGWLWPFKQPFESKDSPVRKAGLSLISTKGGRFTGMHCALVQFWASVIKMAASKLLSRHFWPVFSGENLGSKNRFQNTVSILGNFNLLALFWPHTRGIWSRRYSIIVSRTYITWIAGSFVLSFECLVGLRFGPLFWIPLRP